MNADYSPIDTLERAIRSWWLVVLFVLLGGLAGWAVFRARSPVYEARIVYNFSIDFTRTGVLTDTEEDQALEAVIDVLASNRVLEEVSAGAAAQGIATDPGALRAASSRERTAFTWMIRVQNTDPVAAATLANLWGERGAAALSEASGHAITVGLLQRRLDQMEGCLQSIASTEPVQATCNLQSLPDLQAQIAETGAALRAEQEASLGMMPGLEYNWTEKATVPTRPVLYGQGTLILAGAIIGLALAVAVIQSGLADIVLWKRRHA